MSESGRNGSGGRRRSARSEQNETGQKPDAIEKSPIAKGLELLARREHSARELATKLLKGGHDRAESAAAIDQLRANNQQSDTRFAELLARSRAARGYGPRRIVAELKSHGVGDVDIAAALADADCDWKAAAQRQLERHYGRAAPAKSAPHASKERARRAAFLLRRGFDAATVSALTRTVVDDSDDAFE
ncbi:MAG: regulatory protein RecX [Dokdonella sp.]